MRCCNERNNLEVIQIKSKMTRIVFAAIIISVFALSCNKTDNSIVSGKGLQGTWELTKSYGGWVGMRDYPPGNGNTITFTSTTYTQHFVNADSSFSVSGDYIIHYGKPCGNSSQGSIINFDTNTSSDDGQVISITNGMLKIESPSCWIDGGGSTYRKIGN